MTDGSSKPRRAAYLALLLLGLAFGWIEASVVIYLRQIYLLGTRPSDRVQFPFVSLPPQLVAVEVVREACTLVVLAAIAWVAGCRWRARTGVFLLLFGLWDLTYYVVLKLVVAWPESLTTWDILFLIPVPWIAPVWAPAIIATMLVIAGTYLFWTADHRRQYRSSDIAIMFASALVIVTSFLADWRNATSGELPHRFSSPLFWAGVLTGAFWFVRVERRVP